MQLHHLTAENRRLVELRQDFQAELAIKPELFWPYLRPCPVKVLIVIDGLSFTEANFGLNTFVRTLLDMPGAYVRFRITLANIFGGNPALMMAGENRIVNRITSFKFDDLSHFTQDLYDEVFLFGIASTFPNRGNASNGQPYPNDRLADPELRAITQFMNAGGGLFATGDHGSLGRALCHAIPRARNMRLWESTSAQVADDEVSMAGPRRNDTNRIGGSAGSQFNDQSDDVPQPVQPKMYTKQNGIFRYRFPHPLLCGPDGVIRVMPDHPHEGECITPPNPNLAINIGGPLGAEYPAATGAGPRPLPEIISTSTVLSGITSGGKDPTVPQSFGGICAYDGHRAGIGRVVTDATWHHFVNVNLVGDTGLPALDPKRVGFLATPAGQAHLEEIRAYFRNLAVWLAPPARIRCMNARLAWTLVWNDRVMEAVLSTPDVKLDALNLRVVSLIGRHARDVLGRFAGQCQAVRLILDLVLEKAVPKLIPEIDPWLPESERLSKAFDGVEWFDASPLLDIALGGALVAIRESFPEPDEKRTPLLETEKLQEVMLRGALSAMERGVKSAQTAAGRVRSELKWQ
jgi:hypothetical protein